MTRPARRDERVGIWSHLPGEHRIRRALFYRHVRQTTQRHQSDHFLRPLTRALEGGGRAGALSRLRVLLRRISRETSPQETETAALQPLSLAERVAPRGCEHPSTPFPRGEMGTRGRAVNTLL